MTEKPPQFAHTVIRRRGVAVLLCLLAALAAASGARKFEFSTDYHIYFSADNPQIEALQALERTYTQADNVLFLITPESGSIFNEAGLQAVAALTEAAWQLPYASRVDSLTNFQHSRAEGDQLIVEDLVSDPDSLTAADTMRVRNIALDSPQLAGRLVSENGRATVVAATFHLPEGDGDAVREVARQSRQLARRMEGQYPDVGIDVTGVVMLDREFARAAEQDMMTIYPLMAVFLFCVMMVLLRSALAALAAMLVVGLSSATAMGLAGWTGIMLTSPSAAASVIVLIIAVADSIHILLTTSAEMNAGRSKKAAIAESLRLNMTPVFITSITTMIGFLSLNWSEAPPFRHFGNIAAAGAAVAWIYSIVLLPALMTLLPDPALSRAMQGRAVTTRLVEMVIRRRRAIMGGTLVLALASIAAAATLRIDDSFIGYFSHDTAFRQAAEHMQDHLPGLMSLEYSLPSGEEGGINEPEYLRRLARFADWLEDQPKVGHVAAITNIMRRLNKNMHGDDPAYYRLPESRELAAQYLLLYELSLPYGLDLNNRVDIGKSATRLTAALERVSLAEIRDLKRRSENWLAENFPSARETRATGVTVIFTFLTIRNIESMLTGTAIAFVLISASLVIALRSLKLGGMSLVVNVLPVIVGFGIWGLLVGQIGIYASFVAAAALGLIVDFTVHFLTKYLRARRENGATAADAVRYAYGLVGAALWTSALILLVGFAALMMSDFLPNAYFGVMTAIVIACALLADFLVLPAFLLMIDPNGKRHGPNTGSRPA